MVTGHMANFKDCPGWKAICKACGKRGHVSKCCRSGKVQKKVREVDLFEEDVEKMVICQVSGNTSDGPYELVLVNDAPVKMLFDSGAKIT